MPVGRPQALRLPMAGRSWPGDGGEALRRLLWAVAPSPGLSRADTALGAWALWGSPDPDAAWSAWRSLLGRGLEGGPGGRGTWDAPHRPPGATPEAGIILCAFAHGLLGLVPDAPSGRIRIAPSLPGHLSAFHARGMRVGETDIEMRYEREGLLHRFRLEPTRGRVPVTAVFEPALPVASLEGARVDGTRADLHAVAVGSRVRCSVQLVLDAPRTVEMEAGEAPPRRG